MPPPLTAHVFASLIGSAFTTVLADGTEYVVTLHSCTPLDAVPGGPRSEPFSLVFLGPPGGHLPQHTATLHHPTLGELSIFVVPLGPLPGDSRQQYEAVFN